MFFLVTNSVTIVHPANHTAPSRLWPYGIQRPPSKHNCTINKRCLCQLFRNFLNACDKCLKTNFIYYANNCHRVLHSNNRFHCIDLIFENPYQSSISKSTTEIKFCKKKSGTAVARQVHCHLAISESSYQNAPLAVPDYNVNHSKRTILD